MLSSFVLTLACPDRPGLVFAATRCIAEAGGNILDSQQFTDTGVIAERPLRALVMVSKEGHGRRTVVMN